MLFFAMQLLSNYKMLTLDMQVKFGFRSMSIHFSSEKIEQNPYKKLYAVHNLTPPV